MKANKIDLKGIVRRPQNRATPDGSCAEIIDLRARDGAWEAVGDKEQIEELENTSQFVFHPINAQWEAYVYRVNDAIKAKIINKNAGTSSVVTLLSSMTGDVILKPFYNVLLVSSLSSFSLTSFVFDSESGGYNEAFNGFKDDILEVIQGSVSHNEFHPDVYDYFDDFSYDTYDLKGITVSSGPVFTYEGDDIADQQNWTEYPENQTIFYEMAGKAEAFNIPLGELYVQIVLNLSDGGKILVGPLTKIKKGFFWIDNHVTAAYFRIGNVNNSLKFSEDFLNFLKGHNKGIVRSVSIYASRPQKPELVFENSSFFKYNGIQNIKEIDVLKEVSSYKLDFINIDDDSGSSTYRELKHNLIRVKEQDDLSIDTVISVYDSLSSDMDNLNTPHAIAPLKDMSTYNDRVLLAGVGVNLSSGYMLNKFVSDVLEESRQSRRDSRFVYTRAVTQSSYYTLSIYFKVDTNEGTKVVKSNEIQLNLFDPDDTNKIAFALQNIQYPDSRAFEYVVMLKIPSSFTSLTEDGHYSITKKLKKHDFLDLAYDDETFVIRNKYPTSELLPSQLTGTLSHTNTFPAIDTTYKDLNRVQASASGTVFSFPARYSYRVGMDEVMNVTSVTDELSQGQFGQFPLIAFTKGMIWAMEIGSGDVFVSNIVPLANEICNNPASITVVRGGILFSTTEGLKILQGKSVNDVSEAVEGAIERLPIHGKFTLNTILDRNNLTSYVDSVSFKDFLKTAIIGYDHFFNEIIVSGPDKPYSYAYGLDSGIWTKTKATFEAFTNQFPYNYGLKGSSVFDLSQESKGDSKVTMIATRPFRLTPDVYKKIEQVIIRGEFETAEGYLFACTEGAKYRLVSTGSALNTLDQLYLHRASYSAKSFILVITASLKPEQYISDIDVMFSERFTNKLR